MTGTKIGRVEDFAIHPMMKVESGGKKILVVKQGSRFFAIGDTCTHMGCSLSVGTLEGETVRCRCHGSVFNVRTGDVVKGPAKKSEPPYPVAIEKGDVLIDL